jgi:hypothetical protein
MLKSEGPKFKMYELITVVKIGKVALMVNMFHSRGMIFVE